MQDRPYPDRPEGTGSSTTDEARERAAGMAGEARERGYQAAEQGRERTAEGMERGAERLREQVGGQGGTRTMMAERAAEGMERTAGYLREHDTGQMLNEVESYVREHPMQGMAAAVAAGFFIGRMMR